MKLPNEKLETLYNEADKLVKREFDGVIFKGFLKRLDNCKEMTPFHKIRIIEFLKKEWVKDNDLRSVPERYNQFREEDKDKELSFSKYFFSLLRRIIFWMVFFNRNNISYNLFNLV